MFFDNVAKCRLLSSATTINLLKIKGHVVARTNGTMKIYLNATKEGEIE
jgi:hypothetical protein